MAEYNFVASQELIEKFVINVVNMIENVEYKNIEDVAEHIRINYLHISKENFDFNAQIMYLIPKLHTCIKNDDHSNFSEILIMMTYLVNPLMLLDDIKDFYNKFRDLEHMSKELLDYY